jgi:hypothetical protein
MKSRNRRKRPHIRIGIEGLESRCLLTATATASSFPIIDTGQVPFQIHLTPVNIPDAPALQGAAYAQYAGLWLFIGGRTNGLHGFGSGQDFPPEFQNRDIIVINPIRGQVWTRPWSDSTLSTAAIDALTSAHTESVQSGQQLYIIGGYGVDSATNVSTTFDTLTAINVPGLIRDVMFGGDIAAQVRQIQNPIFQVTGGQLGVLGNRFYLVMGQSFLGDYFSPTSVQTYTDQIQSFQIINTPRELAISNYQTSTDPVNFHRRDFRMSPVILPNDQSAIEVYGGVFTPDFSVYRQPITIARSGQITISPYQQFFSQYDSPQIPLYSPSTHTMQTIFLGGISLYNYFPDTQTISEDSNIPFINTITDLVQPPNGADQEYVMPEQLPGLLGTEAAYLPARVVPSYSNGVINLDVIHRPIVIGYMYGGILAQQANFGNSTASSDIFKITLVPNK